MKKVIAVMLAVLTILSLSGCAKKDVAAPRITEGKFPFEIVYEIDGETVTINDTYVCEFDGFGYNKAVGWYREWNGYFQSTGEEDLVLLQDGNLSLAVAVGHPNYYMSDPTEYTREYEPHIYYIIYPNDMGGTSWGVTNIESMLEKYKIKLISWKLSEPIQNSFE